MRNSFVAVMMIVCAVAVVDAQGQPGGAPPPPPANLQVLAKDMPRPQVIQVMQTYTAALGVECNYCHVQEGRGGRNDFAADDKATKKTAREMMKLTRDINDKVPT